MKGHLGEGQGLTQKKRESRARMENLKTRRHEEKYQPVFKIVEKSCKSHWYQTNKRLGACLSGPCQLLRDYWGRTQFRDLLRNSHQVVANKDIGRSDAHHFPFYFSVCGAWIDSVWTIIIVLFIYILTQEAQFQISCQAVMRNCSCNANDRCLFKDVGWLLNCRDNIHA